jgi:opacity protein-like surface antigen
MGIKRLRRIFLCLLLLAAPVFAQSGQDNGRTPVISAPGFEASLGYVFDRVTQASAPTVNLKYGVNANALAQLTRRWGGTLDLTYSRTNRLPDIHHADNVFSALVGPVFFPFQTSKTTVLVHALVGMGWVDTAVPIDATSYYSGYETRFSYAAGGGVEHVLTGPLSLRLTADYQRTTFVGSNIALQGQNNLRGIVSVVYRFGGH